MTSPIGENAIQLQAKANISSTKYNEEELKKLKKACSDFESIFTYQLLKSMRQTIPKVDTGVSNYGKDTYNQLMDQKIAETVSRKGTGLGLQKVLFDQLSRSLSTQPSQEVKNKLK